MSKSLLPPSASLLTQAVAAVCAASAAIPVPLRSLWNPWTCPPDLLPWLAWAFSVDHWDDSWPENIRRRMVADAFYIHRHKGTIAALRRAVSAYAILHEIREWWTTDSTPGTFGLDIRVDDRGLSDDAFQEMMRLIYAVKPCSRHINSIIIRIVVEGHIYDGMVCYGGDIVTVYPYVPDRIPVHTDAFTASAIHLIDTLEVRPQ